MGCLRGGSLLRDATTSVGHAESSRDLFDLMNFAVIEIEARDLGTVQANSAMPARRGISIGIVLLFAIQRAASNPESIAWKKTRQSVGFGGTFSR